MTHKLQVARHQHGWTLAQLAQRSGLAVGTIQSIEAESRPRVNEDTAQAVCAALGMPVLAVFRPEELTHIGRRPKTGVPLTRKSPNRVAEVCCPKCHMVVPTAPQCSDCDAPLLQAA